ncbi:MAG: luciferase family protein [Streptosporangiaceae bacterium]
MADDQGDVLWDQYVTMMLAVGRVQERTSRYSDKPALFTGRREIAHLEARDVIDLRITRAGWSRVSADLSNDPAVCRDPSRRDWIELHLQSVADLERIRTLLTRDNDGERVNGKVWSTGYAYAACGR